MAGGWLDKLKNLGRGGGDKPAGDEPAPTERLRGRNKRTDALITRYHESIGLLQQLAHEGLNREHDNTKSDWRIRKQSMLDNVEVSVDTSRGSVIQVRVPGDVEAKFLQDMMCDALQIKHADCPLKRQPRNTKRDGQPTYSIFIVLEEPGSTHPGISPERAEAALSATLRHLKIEPSWKDHFLLETLEERSAGAAETNKFKQQLEDEEARAAKDRQEKIKRGEKVDDGLTEGERRAKLRINMDGSNTAPGDKPGKRSSGFGGSGRGG